MKNIVSGASSICMNDLSRIVPDLSERTKALRFVCELEKLTVAAVELVLGEAGVDVPVGKETLGIYIGIDDAIEEIKNEHLGNIIKEGLLGASPLLFPFTSPNALAAQATIVFDIRGESVVMPIKGSMKSIIEYADACVADGYMEMAIAGAIFSTGEQSAGTTDNYEGRFYMIESPESAGNRGAGICENVPEIFA
jgi:hypothetical protein